MGKILFVGNEFSSLYVYRKELLVEMLNLGHEVYACIRAGEQNATLTELGVNVIEVDMDMRGVNPAKDIKLFMKYKKVFKKIKPDIIVTYTIKPAIYGGIASRMLKIPFVSTITGVGSAFHGNSIVKKIVVTLYKLAFKKAKTIFFQNDENINLFLDNKIVNQSQVIKVMGSGVDLQKYKLAQYSDDTTIKCLFVGRMMKEKGVIEMLEVIRRLHEEKINVEFDFVGEAKEFDMITEINKFKDEGLLRYHGRVDNIVDFMKETHVVIVPSYHEGMCNVLLEGAASGRPIIASDIAGCRETFEKGVSGLACEAKSADSLYDCLKEFINMSTEQRVEMGIQGRLKVEKEFSRDRVIEKYVVEINKIINKDDRG